jgi:hypothetical protein
MIDKIYQKNLIIAGNNAIKILKSQQINEYETDILQKIIGLAMEIESEYYSDEAIDSYWIFNSVRSEELVCNTILDLCVLWDMQQTYLLQ